MACPARLCADDIPSRDQMLNAVIALSVLCWAPPSSSATAIDQALRTIVDTLDLQPLEPYPFEPDAKYELGRMLFFDPILSGNRDVSCATCHSPIMGTSDGMPRSVGTKGVNADGEVRLLAENRADVRRNALDLWNRDENSVKSLFWDGRVEVLDPVRRLFRSPLGEHLPAGMENALAVQALVPLITPMEMMGFAGDYASKELPPPHSGRINELVGAESDDELKNSLQMFHVLERVMDRLIGNASETEEPWQKEYRTMFAHAYPMKGLRELSIIDVGNALAHFQELAFATRGAPWDKYLRGDVGAISDEAKLGAITFHTHGLCGNCHTGPLFSDFSFHVLDISGSDDESREFIIDWGRFNVTKREVDKYAFRTPPLRNVTISAPYFHNGMTSDLSHAIKLHVQKQGEDTGNRHMRNLVSKALPTHGDVTDCEIAQITSFLSTLETESKHLFSAIVPTQVPSGLRVVNKSMATANMSPR